MKREEASMPHGFMPWQWRLRPSSAASGSRTGGGLATGRENRR